jgi:hypothetical protein
MTRLSICVRTFSVGTPSGSKTRIICHFSFIIFHLQERLIPKSLGGECFDVSSLLQANEPIFTVALARVLEVCLVWRETV